MDKSILKQCASLKREYVDEEKRIQAMEAEIQAMAPICKEVTDVVTKGRRGKKPLGICTIHGNEDNTQINRKRARLRERKAKQELRLARIENMILDVEEYINEIPDSEEKTWNEVAEAMGEGYTGEACKKKVQRELGKI